MHLPSVFLSVTVCYRAWRRFEDDLEGLNTLYPVSSGAIVTPKCFKSPLYLGFIRMVVYVVGPGCLALLLSILLHTCIQSQDEARMKEKEKELQAARVTNLWVRASASTGAGRTSTLAVAKQKQADAAAAAAAEKVEVTVM